MPPAPQPVVAAATFFGSNLLFAIKNSFQSFFWKLFCLQSETGLKQKPIFQYIFIMFNILGNQMVTKKLIGRC